MEYFFNSTVYQNQSVGMQKTTPSGYACHPSTGGELTSTAWSTFSTASKSISGYAKNHPVRLRLPSLHRRGINQYSLFQQHRISKSISGYAKNHPVRLRLPPLHRRGINQYSMEYFFNSPVYQNQSVGTQKTTPSGYACHPSTGGELTSTAWSTFSTAPFIHFVYGNHDWVERSG